MWSDQMWNFTHFFFDGFPKKKLIFIAVCDPDKCD